MGDDSQLLGKSDKPFAYLCLVAFFNEIDTEQSHYYTQISCHNYINGVMRSHCCN